MAVPGTNGAYWLRLHVAEFDDPRWLIIESYPEVADSVQIIYVKLLSLAARCNAGGMLVLPGGKPYGEMELAAVLRRQPATVRAALQMLMTYGFAEWVGDPPVIFLPAWLDQDVDALALLAAKRQKDAERKRLKRSEIKQLQASADVSAEIPRNVRPHSKNKSNIKKTAASEPEQPAAISPTAQDQNPIPSPDVVAAIDLLPVAARLDCLAVVLENLHLSSEILISNIQILAGRLVAPKGAPISNPAGWLQKALTGDYAASQRQTEAETIAAKNRAAAKKQEKAEQEEWERRAELQRQAQLLRQLEGLDPGARAEVEREAEEQMRQIGAGAEPMRLACLAQAAENFINGGFAA